MKIELAVDKCIAAGMCFASAPELFDQDDTGYSVILNASPGPDQEEAARSAVSLCPAAAIHITE
jgi:ferredoxin